MLMLVKAWKTQTTINMVMFAAGHLAFPSAVGPMS